MIKRAVKNGFKAKYVLADSWFTSLSFIKEIREIKDGKGVFNWNEFSELLIKNSIEAQSVFEVKDIQAVEISIEFLKKNKLFPFG